MQMLASWAGGSLRPVIGHVCTHHKLIGCGDRIVNSFHNFCLEECPPGFEVLAVSEDGCIEAVKHKTLMWEGWMWHPEREATFNECDITGFRRLLS